NACGEAIPRTVALKEMAGPEIAQPFLRALVIVATPRPPRTSSYRVAGASQPSRVDLETVSFRIRRESHRRVDLVDGQVGTYSGPAAGSRADDEPESWILRP